MISLTRFIAAPLLIGLCLVGGDLLGNGMAVWAKEQKATGMFPIKENIIMLYYKDISQVAPFYEDTLGLTKTFDQEWAKIYQLTPTSFVGVIQEGEGSYHRAQPENAVMLSIVTDRVDSWYGHLKQRPQITFIKDIYNNEHAPIRAFLIKDPGGYSLEFFQWLEADK